ncbi:MAG: GGDEF domain-containing protein [Deltaproteobacteria bacterium]|nr:GGDEF domain-containing protein [Deltaproteobacteria bacterium]
MDEVSSQLEELSTTAFALKRQLEEDCGDPSECSKRVQCLIGILEGLRGKGYVFLPDLRLDEVLLQVGDTSRPEAGGDGGSLDRTAYVQDLIDRLSELSMTDGLTGLYNHRYFKVQIGVEFKRAVRFEQTLSLIMLDVDHFKSINDTYGHPFGDKVLKRIGEILHLNLRASDIAVRYGGEEFAVLLLNAGIEQAYYVANKIRLVIEAAEFTFNDRQVKVTVSAGVASFALGDDLSSRELIETADQYMYMAKKLGRNRVYTDRGVITTPQDSEVSTEERSGLSDILKG